MNKTLFKSYAEIRSQIDELSKKEAELKEEIEKEMISNEVKSADTDLGKFTIAEYKSYVFNEGFKKRVKPLEEKIAELKEKEKEQKNKIKEEEAKEIESGNAELKVKESLRFTPKKNDK